MNSLPTADAQRAAELTRSRAERIDFWVARKRNWLRDRALQLNFWLARKQDWLRDRVERIDFWVACKRDWLRDRVERIDFWLACKRGIASGMPAADRPATLAAPRPDGAGQGPQS